MRACPQIGPVDLLRVAQAFDGAGGIVVIHKLAGILFGGHNILVKPSHLEISGDQGNFQPFFYKPGETRVKFGTNMGIDLLVMVSSASCNMTGSVMASSVLAAFAE